MKDHKNSFRFLLFLLALSACALTFNSCNFGGGGGDNDSGNNNPKNGGTEPIEVVTPTPDTEFQDPDADYIVPTDPDEFFKPTPESSPGNPTFIDVNFTDEEYESSPSYVAFISREFPEADFTEFGIHVNMKDYNLHNESDELYIELMPDKIDPTYGYHLHTCNFWLRSGQDKFPTEVELTMPIPDGEVLRNVLWHNWDTGKWEELFYTVADDGKSCTAYIDHFSEVATATWDLSNLKAEGDKILHVYDPRSIFMETECDDPLNHFNASVSVVPTADFEKIARTQTQTAEGVFNVLKRGGGVPLNAGMTEGLTTFGDGMDAVSNGLTVLWTLPWLASPDSFSSSIISGGFSAVGLIVLNLRLIDMTLRGVSPKKVIEENRWTFISTYVGAYGSLASLAGMTGTATVCSWACVAIFAGTVCYNVFQAIDDANLPYGHPETLEQNAIAYYAQTVGLPIEVLQKHDVYSLSDLYADGTGWADALDELLRKNKDIMDAEKLGNKIEELYKDYVDYFWTLPLEEQQEVWLDALAYLNSYPPYFEVHKGEYDNEEFQRYLKASAGLQLGDKTKTLELYCKFGKMSPNEIARAKSWAMDGITRRTSRIVYDLILKDYHNNIMEARRKVYEEILPKMNATLLFYAEDLSLNPDEPICHSLYYGFDPLTMKSDPKKMCKMGFLCSKKALFASHNAEPWWTLYLEPNDHTATLARCKVYYYLQFDVPQLVHIRPAKDSGLQELFDAKAVLSAGTPYQMKYSAEYGYRVPIRFNGTEENLDKVVVDTKLRIHSESGCNGYNPYDIIDAWGSAAEEHMKPQDVHVKMYPDGLIMIDIPEIKGFKYATPEDYHNFKYDYTFSRNELLLDGQVIESKEVTDDKLGTYTVFTGVITGDHSIASHQEGDFGSTGCTGQYYNVNNTEAYQQDGNSWKFSKFNLYYFQKEQRYAMVILMYGDLQIKWAWSDGSTSQSPVRLDSYYFNLSSTATMGDMPEDVRYFEKWQ